MSYDIKNKIRNIIDGIELDDNAEVRMLHSIRNKAALKNKKSEPTESRSARVTKWAVSAVACLAVFLIGTIVIKGGFLNTVDTPAVTLNKEKGEGSCVTDANEPASENIIEGSLPVTVGHSDSVAEQGSETVVTDAGLTGDGSYFESFPESFTEGFGGNLILVGESITDGDAALYFEENYLGIRDSLSESGVPTEELYICENGYCHVNISAENGQSEIRQNSRDYLVYSGDELVAIVNLYMENGSISNNIMFGASWFDDYRLYLEQHKGEELLYLYAGMTQIIIAPDDSLFNPMGYDISEYFSAVDDRYELFYNENVIYIP